MSNDFLGKYNLKDLPKPIEKGDGGLIFHPRTAEALIGFLEELLRCGFVPADRAAGTRQMVQDLKREWGWCNGPHALRSHKGTVRVLQ